MRKLRGICALNSLEPGIPRQNLPAEAGGMYHPPSPYSHPQPYPGYGPPEAEEENGFDPLKLIWFVVHYRWLIATLLIIGLISGIVLTMLQTPLYRAAANLEILTSGAKVIQDLEAVVQTSDMRAFENARVKMKSRDLARRVVYELNLSEDETFLAPAPSFSLTNLINRALGTSREADIVGLSAEQREARAVGLVQRNLAIALVRNTSILNISYSHASPKHASMVANQVARSYIDQTVDKTSETSDLARQFIQEQVVETKTKLQESEAALVAYAKQAGITVTGSDASLISENISEINAALGQAIQDRLDAQRDVEQVKAGNASSLPQVFESESIQTTKQKIAELRATYQEKLNTLKPGFPEMVRLNSQIKELQNQIDAEVSAIARAVEIKFEQSKDKEIALKAELAQLESRQSTFQDKNIKYTILKREVDSNRLQYETLINKLNEVGIGSELRSSNASIVDLALPPTRPYTPKMKRNLMLALVLFAAMAAGVIYLLELMNNTFAVPDQIESELKLPVLGVIPLVDQEELHNAFADNKSPISEAYRSLRTSIQFTGTEDAMRTILVTSSEPSEGKSSTAYKLACDFAALGRKVLVIDADLRKPRMHRIFNISNTMGLSNLLSNVVRKGDVSSLFQKTSSPNITVLSSGTIPPNPVDLLMSSRMGLTLSYCAKHYDLVIIDSPPVMGLSDSPILSRQMDATLLVVAAKQVTRKAAKTALARLNAAGGNVVGTAFTRFAVDKLDYNYAYRYMQYNYYSYDTNPAQLEDHASSNAKAPASNLKRTGPVAALLDRFMPGAS